MVAGPRYASPGRVRLVPDGQEPGASAYPDARSASVSNATSALALGGRIGLVALGSGVKAGKVVHTTYDHWSYLRTVEDALGIGEHLNLSGVPTTPAMADVVTP